MEAEDENSVKEKNTDKNKEGIEKIQSDDRTSERQRKDEDSTRKPQNKAKENQTKSLPVKSVKSCATVSTQSLKCEEQVKDFSQIENGISQENKQIMENGHSRELVQRVGKSENGYILDKNSTTAKKSNQNTQPKICKPDSEKKAIQDLKSKIDSARANGKSINALLYDMNQDSGTSEDNTEDSDNVTSEQTLPDVSFDFQGDELSSKLKELKVSDESLNKKLVGASTDESGNEKLVSTSTPEKTDDSENCDYLHKGPMIGYAKHAHHYQPYPRPNPIYQPMPQQVPNGTEICEIESDVHQFYDEEGLLKALNEIVPETNLPSSPEQHFELADLHPTERSYSEILPNTCFNGVNNQFYLNPIQSTSPPQQAMPPVQPSIQPSNLPGDLSYLPCPIPQQRSTSADTIKQTPAVPAHNEPRPNSYPSTHENIDALFKDASDIIFNDLHQSIQQRSTQKTKTNSEATFPGVNPMQKAHPSQQVPANPVSVMSATRSQPLASHGVRTQDTSKNQTFTQVVTAKAPQIHPKSVMASPPKRMPPTQRPNNGNLPHILQDVTDNRNENENPVQTTSPASQKSSMGNNHLTNAHIQQMAHFPMQTQIMGVSTGVPQTQQKAFVNQNLTLVPRQTSPQAPGGLNVNSARLQSGNSHQRGLNQPQMIELPCSNSHQLSQRPENYFSTTIHASQSHINTSIVSHPSNFPFMASLQMANCVPKSQTNCSQGLMQPLMQAPNSQSTPMYRIQKGQCAPSNPIPVQNGGGLPMSGSLVPPFMNSMQCGQTTPNGQCVSQPVQVIVCPTLADDKPKPRFRKILPKPNPPVEGGK